MWTSKKIADIREMLRSQLGKPYEIGGKDPKTGTWIVRGKPKTSELSPVSFDCSGLTRWGIGQGGIVIPHGTRQQILFCKPIARDPRPLDLGFGDMDAKDALIDHVIICLDDYWVIEARGPQKGRNYGKVILRPRDVWEAWKGFFGWWEIPGIYS